MKAVAYRCGSSWRMGKIYQKLTYILDVGTGYRCYSVDVGSKVARLFVTAIDIDPGKYRTG